MTADVPRRLRPTQGQRVQNVVRTHAAQSLGGGTAAARPVPQALPDVHIYRAPGAGGNVVTGDSSGAPAVAIESTITGTGTSTVASGFSSVAVGGGAHATAEDSIAIGHGEADAIWGIAVGLNSIVQAGATYGIAIGLNATVQAPNGVALGGGASATIAAGVNSVAIGAGATASNDNEIALGTTSHIVIVSGQLVLKDGSGGLHRLVVSTGGALSTVAYP